jgi:hypothetical protein
MASRRRRSKTPSDASPARRNAERLASLTFFLDYQIGRYVVAEALRAAGARVEVHIEHFPQAAPDTDWIPAVGLREWVLITKDQNIRRNPLERSAIIFFDKAARRRLARDLSKDSLPCTKGGGGLGWGQLEKHLDAYAVVATDGTITTVGHRYKRIPRP